MKQSQFTLSRRARAGAAGLAAVIAVFALASCGSSTTRTVVQSASNAASPVTVSPSGFTVRVFATGVPIQHATAKGKQSVYQPDDLTMLGGHIFVAFQNGVGNMGETMSGNSNSTVVEFSTSG